MPYINVHVDLDDIYDDMDRSEKEMMAEWLCDDGFVVIPDLNTPGKPSTADIEWAEMITKINSARYQMTTEQEKMLFNLAKSL